MFVFTNSAMSLDGKLGTTARGHVAVGSSTDRVEMSRLRAQADAVLVGGQTFRNWPHPLIEDRSLHPGDRADPMLNIVLTRSGAGPRHGAFFEDPRTQVVVLGGPSADLDGFPQGTVVMRSQGPATIPWALEAIRSVFPVERLLIEAGGEVIFQAVASGVVDEMYVTLCPWLIGGRTAPSMLDGDGFDVDTMRQLTLISQRVEGSELFLRYAVGAARGASAAGE